MISPQLRILFSILLFTAFALRPAIEVSTVMYYQLNIDTIIEKYCVNKERPKLNCNGKCYLMSQMKMSNQDSSEKSQNKLITEAFIPLFFQDYTIKIDNETSLFLEFQKYWKPFYLHLENTSNTIDQPPEGSPFI